MWGTALRFYVRYGHFIILIRLVREIGWPLILEKLIAFFLDYSHFFSYFAKRRKILIRFFKGIFISDDVLVKLIENTGMYNIMHCVNIVLIWVTTYYLSLQTLLLVLAWRPDSTTRYHYVNKTQHSWLKLIIMLMHTSIFEVFPF